MVLKDITYNNQYITYKNEYPSFIQHSNSNNTLLITTRYSTKRIMLQCFTKS